MITNKTLRKIAKVLLVLIMISVLGWMLVLGRKVSSDEQLALYEILRNVAGTMFAVFGLWIALLYPELRNKVFGKGNSDSQSRTIAELEERSESRQADHLLQPFFVSLCILLITVVVDIAAPLVKTTRASFKTS